MRISRYAMLLGLLCGTGAQAQEGSPAAAVNFLERSYFFSAAPRTDVVFEAWVAPHLFIWNSFRVPDVGSADEEAPILDKGKTVSSFSVTPMFRLRQLSGFSNPLRTPSYMPKINFQFGRFLDPCRRRTADGACGDGLKRRERRTQPKRLIALQAVLGHHSNGQEGCLYQGFARVGDACAVIDPALAAERRVNQQDGSFTTNYIQLSAFAKLFKLQDETYRVRAEYTAGLTLELNPEGFLFGGIEKEQADLYGKTRLKLLGEGRWARRRGEGRYDHVEAAASLEYIDRPAPGVSHLRFIGEVAYRLAGFGGHGFFVRYVKGQDYYNVGFRDDISRLQFGLVFDPSPTPRFF